MDEQLKDLCHSMCCVGDHLADRNAEIQQTFRNSDEKEDQQKWLILISVVLFISGFVTAGLNYRYSWFILPQWVVIAASILLLFGYALWAEVMRENAFSSRTVEIQENQKVIDTGLLRDRPSSDVCGGAVSFLKYSAGSRLRYFIHYFPRLYSCFNQKDRE